MSRRARQFSASGYLHLIVRGISRQALFEEGSDYRFYLYILKQYARETGVTVCAYCLMENHVHLLVHDRAGMIPVFMQKIGVAYSGYFNRKYDRCGHLFQDRYLSENVERTRDLLTVFRYILNNPRKAGICPAEFYPWSSYPLYGSPDSFVDTSVFYPLIGSFARYRDFMAVETDDECMDYTEMRTDEWARERIRRLLNVENGMVLQKWDASSRNEALKKLKDAGLSIRQIERLTGIGRNIIQRAR